MSIFLNEQNSYNYLQEAQELGITFLNEDYGIISFVKKFYTGSDTSEIKEFTERIKNCKTEEEKLRIIAEIEDSIQQANEFKRSSWFQRFLAHGIAGSLLGGVFMLPGISAAAVTQWFKTGRARVELDVHIQKLNQLATYAHSIKTADSVETHYQQQDAANQQANNANNNDNNIDDI